MTKKTHDEKLEEIVINENKDQADPKLNNIDEEINWEEKYKRALADYQNLEKRSHDQRREWIISSNKELVLRILPVLDTLILAQKHSEDKSIEVSVKQFLDIFKTEGVTKIEAVGHEFNPHTMEAVATTEGEDGVVVDEVQSGYLMNDKLLRPALVKVGKKE